MSIDVSHLSPQDAAAALRSYPRRYGAVLASMQDDDQREALLTRPGADGRSVLDVARETASVFASTASALRAIEVQDDPDLGAPAAAPPSDPSATGASVLADLEGRAEELASAVDRVSAGDWKRSGHVPGGASVNALDLVRQAVAAGADNLRQAESTLAAVRAR